MRSEEVRKAFLDFFARRGHTVVPSSPVVPIDDPTLLFTNAGMNQFKDIFLGKVACPYDPPRAASVQKCIRVSGKHNDLEQVGADGYHHTFFEMLGNWSFGEYFKREAILWAWELLTEVYGIPSERLWAAVYEEDDEAYEIWVRDVGLPAHKVVRCGVEHNFWEMADTGPCGPTTEIHYDWGEQLDPDGLPNSSERFVEVWNIVFMQYFRDERGELHPLPAKNVDTGMGFERLVAILQGTQDNYETDIFAPLIDRIADISGRDYSDAESKFAFRVLADHTRALAFAIADGALPGNTGRGYVLRRILRRAARFSRKLGVQNPILWRLVPPLVDKMGDVYPELRHRADLIAQVIKSEEERFGKTLDFGIELFERVAERVISQGESVIPGEDVFKLYDTYGFPVDLTQLMAAERGLSIDVAGFERLMAEQRERARSSATFEVVHKRRGEWEVVTEGEDSKRLCYETEVCEADVRLVRVCGEGCVELVLSQTPFYAEAGGQVGDTGTIRGDGFALPVCDTQWEGEHIVHRCEGVDRPQRVVSQLRRNPRVVAEVDHERRAAIRRNHTATHILHKALRTVLGEHARQAGSLVAPDRLRFDYTHFEAPTPEQLAEIEAIANDVIRRNIPVKTEVLPYREAIARGAIALFGEKYGDVVRMVSIGDFSRELCGGTHVGGTGEIGLFLITREESIGSGMRRIEALTGEGAFNYVQGLRRRWRRLEEELGSTGDAVFERLHRLRRELEELRRSFEKLGDMRAKRTAETLLQSAAAVGDGKLIVAEVSAENRNELMAVMDELERLVPSGVILLGARLSDGKVGFVCRVTPDFVRKHGINAGDLVRRVAQITGGGGGGRADFAQAGGTKPDMLGEALEFAKKHIAHQMTK